MDILLVKKVVAAFLVPPGCFVLLLLVSGLLFLRRGRMVAALVSAAMGGALWLASLLPVSTMLIGGLERGVTTPEVRRGDVIILLGGGVVENARDLTGTGVPTGELMLRVVTAVRLQKKLGVPVIVSGGSVFPGMTAEAQVVQRFLRDLGVPESMIIVEARSRDTSENARFSRAICDRKGYRRPILVTSGVHTRRAVAAFAREGLRVDPVPAYLVAGLPRRYVPFHYLPDAGALAGTATAMRECVGLIFYWIGGR